MQIRIIKYSFYISSYGDLTAPISTEASDCEMGLSAACSAASRSASSCASRFWLFFCSVEMMPEPDMMRYEERADTKTTEDWYGFN